MQLRYGWRSWARDPFGRNHLRVYRELERADCNWHWRRWSIRMRTRANGRRRILAYAALLTIDECADAGLLRPTLSDTTGKDGAPGQLGWIRAASACACRRCTMRRARGN